MFVNSFYRYNDFYQCNNACNRFAVIGKNDSGVTAVTFEIPFGNPNVIDILNCIDVVLKPGVCFHVLMIMSKTNLYLPGSWFKHLEIMSYILILSHLTQSWSVLGFKHDTEVLISFNDAVSTYAINKYSIIVLNIGIDGDTSFNNYKMESNLNHSV
jgi:hypothetical protein